MIRMVSEILQEVCRDDEFCGHVGGDDFVVITKADRTESLCPCGRLMLRYELIFRVPSQSKMIGWDFFTYKVVCSWNCIIQFKEIINLVGKASV